MKLSESEQRVIVDWLIGIGATRTEALFAVEALTSKGKAKRRELRVSRLALAMLERGVPQLNADRTLRIILDERNHRGAPELLFHVTLEES